MLTKGITWLQLVLHVLAFNRGVQAQERAHRNYKLWQKNVSNETRVDFLLLSLPGQQQRPLCSSFGKERVAVPGGAGAAWPKRQLTLAPADGNSPGQGSGDRTVFFLRTPAFPKRNTTKNRSNL